MITTIALSVIGTLALMRIVHVVYAETCPNRFRDNSKYRHRVTTRLYAE